MGPRLGQAQVRNDLGEDGIIDMKSSLLFHQAIYKCLLDRVPDEEKDTNVQ